MTLGLHPEGSVDPDDLPVEVLVEHDVLHHVGELVGVAKASRVRHGLGEEVADLKHKKEINKPLVNDKFQTRLFGQRSEQRRVEQARGYRAHPDALGGEVPCDG